MNPPAAHEKDDLAAIQPTPFARVGGGVLIAAGLLSALLALQASSMVRLQGVVLVFMAGLGLLGLAAIALGWNLRRMRGWAALGGTIAAAAGGLLSGAWLVLSLANGLLSLFAFLVPLLYVSGAVFAALSLGAARLADQARERMRDQGLDAGI